MREVALPDYRATEGNLGAWCLHRADGDVVHVEMFTLWRDWDSISRFAGEDVVAAKYYDFDADYLLEIEPTVIHFEAIRGYSITNGQSNFPTPPRRRPARPP